MANISSINGNPIVPSNGSVGTDQLADGSVTMPKLGSDVAITPQDGSITDQMLDPNGILSTVNKALTAIGDVGATYESGKYVMAVGVGETIDITSFGTSSNTAYAVVQWNAGDELLVAGRSGNAEMGGLFITDSSYNVLFKTGNTRYYDGLYTAEVDGYVVLNTVLKAGGNKVAHYAGAPLFYAQLANNVYKLENSVGDIAQGVISYDFDHLKPYSIAHRGYYAVAPQNTLPAFRLAKSKGFDFIETDLCRTADGVYVMCHDDDITTNNRARNMDGSAIGHSVLISQSTYAELLQYDFGIYMGSQYAGTPIPTFEEVVRLCKEIQLYVYIDIKAQSTYNWTKADFDALDAILKTYDMDKSVMWACSSKDSLRHVIESNPSACVGGYGTVSPTSVPDYLLALKTGKNRVFHATYLPGFDTDEIELMHGAGIMVGVYAPSTLEEIAALDPRLDFATTENFSFRNVLYEENIGDPETGLLS